MLIDDILAASSLTSPPTKFVLAHSFDGYSTNVPVADLVGGKAMVALNYEGKPLPPDHGGPARLLVPHLYFWKSAKWVSGLQFTRGTRRASGSCAAITSMATLGASSASPVTDTPPALAGAPKLNWQEATIIGIASDTPRVKSFLFATPAPIAFRAGQHVDVRLTAPDGYQAERSYSIASAPERTDGIELAIERLDDGEVSPFFHEVAEIGDAIELRGPIGGHFVWSVEDGGPLLLLGGGSGVVPLMSMLRHRAARGSNVPALLLFSARTWEDVIFRDELIAMHDKNDGFNLALALTRDEPRRPEDFGRRVDRAMVAELVTRLPAPPRHVFICGGNPFVEAASEGAIEAGIAAPMIRTERYGG